MLREVDGSHEAVGFVSHETLVFFAVEFADYALKNYTQQKRQEAESCIALTRQWLKSQDSVSKEELRGAADAAYAASNAAYADANAVRAASNAAADAANAVRAYAAAHAAACASNAAAYAAHAANAANAAKSKKKEQERQGNFILSYFNASVIQPTLHLQDHMVYCFHDLQDHFPR